MLRSASLLLLLAPAFALSACVSATDDGNDEQDVTGTTTYINIQDFSKIDQGAWYDSTSKLNAEFAASCGDTFCGGDFSNLTPLTFSCSVTAKEGIVHACAWTFTASQLSVDPTTARIQTNVPTFVCPILAKTSAVKLAALLSTSVDSLHAELPGEPSINEQLAGCFDHPIGATPIVPVAQTPATYVDASDYYTTATSAAKWTTLQTHLLNGFNNICGDTFCSSDFNDLQSLDFECAVTKSSGNVKSCAWVFGGSVTQVDATHGTVDPTTKSFRCNVAVKGTLPQLISVLNAAGDGAIQTNLPGETTTAYDALGGCLP